MNRASEAWYIRLPDGRVLHARSTAAVRHHVLQGNVPRTCWVRRTPQEKWQALGSVPEFADLITPLSSSRREDSSPAGPGPSPGLTLQTVGMRGLLAELLAALDSALGATRLRVAAAAGFLLGLALALGQLGYASLAGSFAGHPLWAGLAVLGASLAFLILFSGYTVAFSALTYLELAHLRPVSWREALSGLGWRTGHLGIAWGLLGLLVGLGGLGPFWLPREWLSEAGSFWSGLVGGLGLVGAVGVVLLAALALLLGPVVVVEELPAWSALRQWLHLLWQQGGRAVLCQILVLWGVVLLTGPLWLVVEGAAYALQQAGLASPFSAVLVWLLRGLALTPALAFLPVAQVFLYLWLRYEHTPITG